MSLIPSVKTNPRSNLLKEMILLYSQPGAGKSYLAANLDEFLTKQKVVILDFDGGLEQLSVYKIDCTGSSGWELAQGVVDEVLDTQSKTRKKEIYIVVDTITKAFRSAEASVMKKYGVKLNSDLGFKGWGEVTNAIDTFMVKLKRLQGVMLLSHASLRNVPTETGSDVEQWFPDLPEKRYNKILGDCDHVVRLTTIPDIQGKDIVLKRVLTGKPSLQYENKSRGGVFARNMDADWNNIIAAYNYINNTGAAEAIAETKTESK